MTNAQTDNDRQGFYALITGEGDVVRRWETTEARARHYATLNVADPWDRLVGPSGRLVAFRRELIDDETAQHEFRIGDAVTVDGTFAWVVVSLKDSLVEVSTPAGGRQLAEPERLRFVERTHALDDLDDLRELNTSELHALRSLLRRAHNDGSLMYDDDAAIDFARAIVHVTAALDALSDEATR